MYFSHVTKNFSKAENSNSISISNSTFYNAVELEMAYYFSLSKMNLGECEKYMTAQKIVRPFFITAVHFSIIKLSYEKDVFLYPCHF